MLIEMKNVTKTIKGHTVLNNISWNIERGEAYGVIGANGSGKTMLLRAICGFLSLSEGYIQREQDITFGIIIENPVFINELTGFENLEYLSNIRKIISKEKIYQSLERVGLKPDDLRSVKTYSLGMKQRLAIAQAIMEQPDVLILDEPTRGLDEHGMVQIRNVLLEEKARGATLLIASHDIQDIQELCDKIIRIENAKLCP